MEYPNESMHLINYLSWCENARQNNWVLFWHPRSFECLGSCLFHGIPVKYLMPCKVIYLVSSRNLNMCIHQLLYYVYTALRLLGGQNLSVLWYFALIKDRKWIQHARIQKPWSYPENWVLLAGLLWTCIRSPMFVLKSVT